MLLIEKCESMSELLERHKTMKKDQLAAQSLEERRKELAKVRDDFISYIDKINIFLQSNVLRHKDLPTLNPLTDKVKLVLDAFLEDASKITKGRLYYDLSKRAENLGSKIEKTLQSAWARFYKLHVIDIDNNLLNKFRESGQFQNEISNVNSLHSTLTILKNRPPYTIDGLEEFISSSEELRDEYNNIQGTDLPDDVAIFLRAASSPKGAGLELLTPSIRNWLESNKMFNKFRVRE